MTGFDITADRMNFEYNTFQDICAHNTILTLRSRRSFLFFYEASRLIDRASGLMALISFRE